jgi:ribosome-binding protein aMBF1 (putative translation factor)
MPAPALVPSREVTLHLRVFVLRVLEAERPPEMSLAVFMAQLLEVAAAERRAKAATATERRGRKSFDGPPIEDNKHVHKLSAAVAQRALFLKTTHGLTARQIAERLGKSESVIRRIFSQYAACTHVEVSTPPSVRADPESPFGSCFTRVKKRRTQP